MQIHIFDIDGTITRTDADIVKQAGYSTHAYWDLITYHFATNPTDLAGEIASWRKEVSLLDMDGFITSSADMLERSLQYLPGETTEQDIIARAQRITEDFIEHGVVDDRAVALLNAKANDGNICILSTGSYQSGAIGFLNALYEADMISPAAFENIIVSGAIVDWTKKQVKHANIHKNKIKGLNDILLERFNLDLQGTLDQPVDHDIEVYVYADDPSGNDYGILTLAEPERRFVIPNDKNHEESPQLEYNVKTWDEINNELIPQYTFGSWR